MAKPHAKDRWVYARPAGGTDTVLDRTHIEQWRSAGYTLASGLIDEALVTDLVTDAQAHFPDPDSDDANAYNNFGSNMVFPNLSQALTDITLHPRLLRAVAELLDESVTDIRLTQSDVWPKYGREEKSGGKYDHSDQRIHVDYPNHMLTHPTEWHRPEAVEIIIYYSDVKDSMGATAVVPRQGETDPAYPWPITDSPGIAGKPYINDRESAEADLRARDPKVADWRQSLYDREVYTHYKAGDVLLYRHDTWHRGTPMTAGAFRLAHNLTFRRAHCEWISTLHIGWSWSAYQTPGYLERLISQASLEQRAVLGFPQPGSSYWTPATIAAVEARHAAFGMDMTPYRDAVV